MLNIRKAEPSDYEAVWQIFHEVISLGETYSFSPDTDREEALDIWVKTPTAAYVAELDGEIVGTYFIKPNQPALGSHVCNCGYMVTANARNRGVARAMCMHSQEEALSLGFRAMQFNFVVSTNEGAIRLWQSLGFDIIGTVPKAFNHTKLGLVDAHVMYKWLDSHPAT